MLRPRRTGCRYQYCKREFFAVQSAPVFERRFENWGRTFSCRPAARAFPRTEAQVVELVRAARIKGRRVKVVGAGHSWSDIALTDGVLVSLDRMNRVIDVDRGRRLVTVQAGIRLTDLNVELQGLGLAMPILGSISEQSLAGVMSTGTHGSSLAWGNMATLARSLRLVTASGDVLVLDAGDERYHAAAVGLGALGIVTEVTLEVDARFNLAEETEPVPFQDAVADLPNIARSAEYVKLWWLPHTDVVQVFRYHRTDEAAEIRRWSRWFDKHVLNGVLFPFGLWVGKVQPDRIDEINAGIAEKTFVRGRRVVPSELGFNLAMPPVHRETEYAIPVEHTAEALKKLRELIDREGLKVGFITEVRFVKGDDNWMSPAYGRDTCQLGAYCHHGRDADRYFAGVRELMSQFDGRPHWGKELDLTPEEVDRAYPKAKDFRKLAFELDPEGVFTNTFLDRVLGAQRKLA